MTEHRASLAAILRRPRPERRGGLLEAVLWAFVAGFSITLIVLALAGCASSPAPGKTTDSGMSASEAEGALGIEVAGARLSAAGYMVDFRYKVTDPTRAASLLDRKVTPYLQDESSGARFMVPDTPKLGSLRPTANRNAVHRGVYYMLFANPGRFLKPGSKVVLVVGDTKIAHLTVQ